MGVTSEQGQSRHRCPNSQRHGTSEQLGVTTNLQPSGLQGPSLGPALTPLPKDLTLGERPTVGFAQGWFDATMGPRHPQPWADPDSWSPFGPCPLLRVLAGTHSRAAGLDALINGEAFGDSQQHLGVSTCLPDLAPRQPQLPGSRPRERAAR